MNSPENPKKLWKEENFRRHVEELFGTKDTSGIEIFSLIRYLANLSETVAVQGEEDDLTGARWRLMLRLLGEEHMGNPEGLTPTVLSQSQNVSKNTISSLLRGLEEQGYIQRNLDSKDYRVFRIQLTDSGRTLIYASAPKRLERLNCMAAALDSPEREQLLALLSKLLKSVIGQANKEKSEVTGG